MQFKEWLISETYNPKILLPYIKHKKEERLKSFYNDHLKIDYMGAMDRLYHIIDSSISLSIALRKAYRCYEIVRDQMQTNARLNDDYNHSYQQFEPDNDLWAIVGALEDLSSDKMPDLEKLL